MAELIDIAMAEDKLRSGEAPEDSPRYTRSLFRTQGLLTLAFGFAFGITLVVLYFVLLLLGSNNPLPFPNAGAAENITETVLILFVIGFIAGTLVAAVYNLLVVRRLNLFGLESSTE